MNYRLILIITSIISALYCGVSKAQPTFEKLIDLGTPGDALPLIGMADGSYFTGGEFRIAGKSGFPYLAKFDAEGQVLWAKEIGEDTPGSVTALAESSDGYFFVVGYTNSLADFTSKTFILKSDKDGNILWSRYFQDATSYYPVTSDHEGGCLIAGIYDANAPFVLHISADGTLLWKEKFSITTPGNNFFTSMGRLSDGSYVLAGNYEEKKGLTSLTKIDRFGALTWFKLLSAPSDIFNWSLCATSDGGFAVCGVIAISTSDKDIYAAKFDSSGAVVWSSEINDFSFEQGMAIIEGQDGDLVSACFGNPTGALILRMNSSGAVQTLNTLEGINFFSVQSIVNSPGGGYMYAGTYRDSGSPYGRIIMGKIDSRANGCHLTGSLFTLHSGGSVSTQSLLTSFGGSVDSAGLKLGADLRTTETDICNVSDVSIPIAIAEGISLSPNPLISEKSILVRCSDHIPPGIYELSLLDLLGKQIGKVTVTLSAGQQSIPFDVSGSMGGTYIVELHKQNDPGICWHAKLNKQN